MIYRWRVGYLNGGIGANTGHIMEGPGTHTGDINAMYVFAEGLEWAKTPSVERE